MRPIRSPVPEMIYEERPWIEVVPCLLTFLKGIVTSVSCAFSASSSLLQILRNSSRRHSVLGIPHFRLPGRKWRCVGVERPSAGKSVTNPALESALPTQVNYTQKEWAAFGIAHLHCDDYIMSKINDVVHYFQSAASKFDQWACKSEASEEYK